MRKRKVLNSEIATSKRPKTKTISKDDQLIPPAKGLSKSEIQDLIQKEILAKLKQSDEKMDELFGRIKNTECISSYEERLYKLQADIKKIKRREQAVLAYMRKLKPSGMEMSPKELNQWASSSSTEPACIMDSEASVLMPPGPVPSATTDRDHSDVVSSTSETQPNNQGCTEVQEETEEVLFCGVALPKKSTDEGFCQKPLKGIPVVDLTSEGKEGDTAAALNSGVEGNNAAVGPSQEQALINARNINSGAGILGQSTLGAPPPQSHPEVPPLPAIPSPNDVHSEVAVTMLPQMLCLGVGLIERPQGIGLRWTTMEAQPHTHAGHLFPRVNMNAQLQLLLRVEEHNSDKSHTCSHNQ